MSDILIELTGGPADGQRHYASESTVDYRVRQYESLTSALMRWKGQPGEQLQPDFTEYTYRRTDKVSSHDGRAVLFYLASADTTRHQ